MMKELNLLPQSYASHKKTVKQKKNIATGSLIGILAVVAIFVGIFGQEMYLTMKKTKLQSEIDRSMELLLENERLDNEISLTKQHIEKAEILKGIKGKDTDGLIDELSKLFPAELKVYTLSYKNNVYSTEQSGSNISIINLSGIAKTKDDIENLWANLRENEKFKDAHIANIAESKDGFTFSLDLIVKGVNSNGTENKQ
ncbi:MAG: PilN domain-containing protein [Clostridium sp.]|uniref:PilN domain-containing protein n=1 Tax=Clostridium sp. TaxID=1506 RepID=UPI003F355C0E